MNKETFLLQLRQKLTALSVEEREAAMTYYEEYFNDAGLENEQAVINELGSVEKVANVILKENNYPVLDNNYTGDKYNGNTENPSKEETKNVNYFMVFITIVIMSVIVTLAFPFIVAIFGIILGLIGAGVGLIIGGIALTVTGIVEFFINPIQGLLVFSLGLILFATGTLMTAVIINICIKGIPSLIRSVIRICKYPFQRGGVNI